jgi:lariat debranching enzyme
MACPPKYRELGDFHEHYSGSRKAPYLTIFVGGNHEASSYLWELYYGGWVAPNIYYMGTASVVRLGPLRIAGMSGIWKGYNYNKPHYERLPYNDDDIKSIYHVRELDIRKLLQIRTQVDICISHDWPRAIEKHGDSKRLFRMKPHFEEESKDGTLGNSAASYVLDRLRPPYWFSAHMHCKFAAIKSFTDGPDPTQPEGSAAAQQASNGVSSSTIETNAADGTAPGNNSDEIELDLDDDDDEPSVTANGSAAPIPPPIGAAVTNTATQPSSTSDPSDLRSMLPAAFQRPIERPRTLPPGQPCPTTITNKTVRFFALDKCLPGRKFLQLLDVTPHGQVGPSTSTAPYRLEYDLEWLAITRVFASQLTLGNRESKVAPSLSEEEYLLQIQAEEAWVQEHIVKPGKLVIPENFSITAPIHEAGMPEAVPEGPQEYNNPQTAAFCELVGIENRFHATDEERATRMAAGPAESQPRRDNGGFNGRGQGWGRGRGGGRGHGGGRGGQRGRGYGQNRGRGRGW